MPTLRSVAGNAYRGLQNQIDLRTARSVDISGIDSVCLALGPYRNLTTFTASLIALHPDCQVLNHGGERIFSNREMNFLLDYDRRKFDYFVQYAIMISASGRRGMYGGSIIHSHAFDGDHAIRDAYLKRFGDQRIKPQIKCLFWKESLLTNNLIRENNVDLGAIFQQNDKLRFLMPVRNPLDCAKSSIKTGHVALFKQLSEKPAPSEVVAAILDEFKWFLDLKERWPDRFFHYYESDAPKDVLLGLASFLGVEPEKEWLDWALQTFEIKSRYEHPAALVQSYEKDVQDRFPTGSKARERLLAFTQPAT